MFETDQGEEITGNLGMEAAATTPEIKFCTAVDLRLMEAFSGKAIKRILSGLRRRKLIRPDGSIHIEDVRPCDRGVFLGAVRRSRAASDGDAQSVRSSPAWLYLRNRLSLYKKNAAKRGIAFELTQADLVKLYVQSEGRCAVTGILFTVEKFGSARSPFAPSIDRADANFGYTWSNVRLTCQIANLAMNVWGAEVLHEFLDRAGSAFYDLRKP